MVDSPRKIVLATRNAGKVKELAGLLAPFNLEVLGLEAFPAIGEIEETGSTFAENALLKARTVCQLAGLPAVSDDSGLEVDALDGRPGVYSARYSESPGNAASDSKNLSKLMQELAGIPLSRRTARFRCCIAAFAPNSEHILAEGSWEGLIALEAAGNNGFGYDPVFFDPSLGRTAAELSREEKNRRSHRASAIAGLLKQWPAFAVKLP